MQGIHPDKSWDEPLLSKKISTNEITVLPIFVLSERKGIIEFHFGAGWHCDFLRPQAFFSIYHNTVYIFPVPLFCSVPTYVISKFLDFLNFIYFVFYFLYRFQALIFFNFIISRKHNARLIDVTVLSLGIDYVEAKTYTSIKDKTFYLSFTNVILKLSNYKGSISNKITWFLLRDEVWWSWPTYCEDACLRTPVENLFIIYILKGFRFVSSIPH